MSDEDPTHGDGLRDVVDRMQFRHRLAENLVSESKAYGYTLSIWGAGALLVEEFGAPDIQGVFLYVTGALVGFALLAGIAFTGFFADVEEREWDPVLVVSMVHLVATLGNLVIADRVIALTAALSPLTSFFLVGVQVTVAYNLLLLLENVLAEWIYR